MKCPICHNGETKDGFTTIILDRDQTILVFRQVPARICDNCGEEYISSQVNKALLQTAREEFKRGVTIEVLNYAA